MDNAQPYPPMMEGARLWKAFLLGAGQVDQALVPDVDAGVAESVLGDHLGRARSRWAGLDLDSHSFMVYLGDRLARDEQVLAQVRDALRQSSLPPFVCVEDLFLACACATDQPGAIETFENVFGSTMAGLARRFSRAHRPPEDLAQSLREKLFVRHPSRPPRIAEYRGVGHLENWLRITATRAFVDESRRAQRTERELPSSEEAILALPSGEDWELRFLKEHYREAFREAFTAALANLPAEERTLLRFHTVGGLSIDQLAGLYGIHRSSAARRLARVREGLLTQTRTGLMRHLRIDRSEFESIMGLIHSHLDVSVARLLVTSTIASTDPTP